MIKAVIHCSLSPQGRGDNAETIHKWHINPPHNYDGIGYHYVILEDGTIENGRPEYWSGAHAYPQNKAIGICLIGIDEFTHAQFISLEKIIKEHNWKAEEVVGHYKVNTNKTCPNFSVETFLVSIGV